MSETSAASIRSITNIAPKFTNGMTIGGTNITSLITLTEYYEQTLVPVGAAPGAVWWDGTTLYQFVNSSWKVVPATPPPRNSGDRGIVADIQNIFSFGIDYYNIPTGSVKADFGTLSTDITKVAGCSNGSRGVFGGGFFSTARSTIQYITISTLGNSTTFGDLTLARGNAGACSNGPRGIFAGGEQWSTPIDYITIATTGNATSFGSLTTAKSIAGMCADTTYGLIVGGSSGSATVTTHYITIATLGNSINFGDLTVARNRSGACAASSRGVIGGSDNSLILEYVTLSTPANANTFGNLLSSGNGRIAPFANDTRGVFSNGNGTFQYVTIATLGNATTFSTGNPGYNEAGSCSGS